jgi:hypothetical protein
VCISPSQTVPDGARALTVQRFVVKGRGARRRLVAHASFAASGAIDPAQTGVALAVRGMDGQTLYEAAIPGPAFRANGSRSAFRYVARPAQPPLATANGLRRVTMRIDRDLVDVVAVGTSPELAAVAAQPALSWALWVGGACVRDLELGCSAAHTAITSCR